MKCGLEGDAPVPSSRPVACLAGHDILSKQARSAFALLLVAACASCGSTRWPSGRKYELAETPELIARRGKIVNDAAADELLLVWIGARVTPGLARIEAATLVVYEDANHDGEPQTGECLLARESRERVEKIVFHDLRTPVRSNLQARLALFVGESPVVFDFPFKRD